MPETVEVAHWLLPWWQFWHGITKALAWPAWSTLFSASALSVTIYLATANGRRDRLKDGAFIEAVALLCDIALVGARATVGPNRHNETWPQLVARFKAYLEDSELMKPIHAVDVTKFPTSHSLRQFLQLRAVLIALEGVAHARAIDNSEAFVRERIGRGETYVRAMMKEARRVGGRHIAGTTFPHHTSDAVKPRFAPLAWINRLIDRR